MEELFTCNECDELQPARAFRKSKAHNGKYYRRLTCNFCENEKAATRVANWRADKSIKDTCKRLNLDFDYVWAYYQSHNGKCEICNDPPTAKRLVIDHDHNTGAFRGLLCSGCNTAIGSLHDSKFKLMQAISYLDKRR